MLVAKMLRLIMQLLESLWPRTFIKIDHISAAKASHMTVSNFRGDREMQLQVGPRRRRELEYMVNEIKFLLEYSILSTSLLGEPMLS